MGSLENARKPQIWPVSLSQNSAKITKIKRPWPRTHQFCRWSRYISILQKKALRIMCGKSRRESTENIFSDLKILKFTDINTYLTGRFMYKFYKKNVPEIFTSFFQCNSSVHGYSTRQREYLHVPPVKSNLSQFSIRYRGVVVWNAILKSKINPDVSEFVFVKSFKAHILDKKFTVS